MEEATEAATKHLEEAIQLGDVREITANIAVCEAVFSEGGVIDEAKEVLRALKGKLKLDKAVEKADDKAVEKAKKFCEKVLPTLMHDSAQTIILDAINAADAFCGEGKESKK